MTNPESPEIEVLRAKVYGQLRQLTALMIADMPDPIEVAKSRKRARIFRTFYDGGPELREALFEAILTPNERAVAKAMREQKTPAKRGFLPWRHRGASLLR